MKKYNKDQAKAMRGTIFTYTDVTGESAICYVAEVDIDKGMTCKLYEDYDEDHKAGEDILCLDLSLENNLHTKEVMQVVLQKIESGFFVQNDATPDNVDPNKLGRRADCAFE